MFYKLSEEEMRSICKNAIENLEKWARLLIDREMKKQYGEDYLNVQNSNGEYIVKTEIRDKIEKMFNQEKQRFTRKIDTLFLDEIVYFLCKTELYNNCFKKCLDIQYPQGKEELREFLNRIIPVRNKLSHSNPISYREAEQAICYSNDFVEGVKEYMAKEGEEQKYNVPNIVRINDSLGNEFYPQNDKSSEVVYIQDGEKLHQFNYGENYSIWVTMDPSFDCEEYDVIWSMHSKKIAESLKFNIKFKEEDVSQECCIELKVISKKRWHKYNLWDQRILIAFGVLPPN